jgi:foldase protein PrsA
VTRPRPILLASLAGAVLLLGACGAGRPEVARVGDRRIDDADLRTAVALQRVIADLQGTPCGLASGGETEAAACERAALSGELLWWTIQPYAEANDIEASRDEVEQAVGQLETQVGRGVLRDALSSRDLTLDDLSELGRRIITLRLVRTAVTEDRVSEERLRELYRERALQFTTVQVNHILVETRAQAQEVHEQVRDATADEFTALAREVSIEPRADETGGELGTATASTYDPAFAEAAVALSPGEISEPVQTRFGWHVIYLVDKDVTPFAEARDGLIEPLAGEEFQRWLVERARELDIEVNPRYGRFVAETFSVEPVRSTDPERDASTSPSATPGS